MRKRRVPVPEVDQVLRDTVAEVLAAPPQPAMRFPTGTNMGTAMPERLARVLAFYLPQYFPIPENDRWWSPGFTEWTNVAKAKPLFPGHWQPHQPADLGFYDLRVPETRERQAQLARDAGVEGFCYWHYWFGGGRRILERPFDEVLNSGQPDFPFCLAWANHSWTEIWKGMHNTTLIEQTYPGREDEEAHFRWASPAFHDPRYVRIDGKPVFVVFAPHRVPEPQRFIEHWQNLAVKDGLKGVYFIALVNKYAPGVSQYRDPCLASFDAVTQHPPHDYLETSGSEANLTLKRRLKELRLGPVFYKATRGKMVRPRRYDYSDVVKHALSDMPDEERFLPCVIPNWDNTPRSGTRGVVYEGSTPELFAEYMTKAVERVAPRDFDKRVIFLKAWNEWAEGNYVEPDATFGHQYLDAIRSSIFRQ